MTRVVQSVAELREVIAGLPRPLHLVPTMGALHAGHAALLDAARADGVAVVMSLFVNPLQFNDAADLDAYPRAFERDVGVAESHGVDVVWAPTDSEMYPGGRPLTTVRVARVGDTLEGEHRPGHFDGVATVVAKLFVIVEAERAYFGQKDGQQAALIRRLVRDLALEIEIRVLPTLRDADGLALSSRNARLSPEDRERALALPRALAAAHGAPDPVAAAREALNGLDPDYVEIVELDGARLLAAAARVGSVRLIDNVLLEGELP